MKLIVMRVVFLTCVLCLLPDGFYEKASAEEVWSSECKSYGEIKPNQNPTFQHLNCLLTNAAIEAKIPPEVVKAVATQESGWRQFDSKGKPLISKDGGIGIMQITNQSIYKQEKLKNDISYNIQAGVEILSSMYARKDLPKIKKAGREVIENWYFPILAYNGTKPINSPLYQSSGKKNQNAYQEKVLAHLESNSYLEGTKLGKFPFKTSDFVYNTKSDKNITFKKMEYTVTNQMHASTYYLKTRNKVIVTGDNVKLRSKPNTSSDKNVVTKLAKNTTLIIAGDFSYNQSTNSKNQFVWYPVKTENQKLTGYISSAYIAKKLDKPLVNKVDDNDVFLSGKAPVNVAVKIMNGKKQIGSAVTDAKGNFKAKIATQKAGSQLTVSYKDHLNTISPSTIIKVADKTAPSAPKVKAVTDQNTKVTGTAEANAIVEVKKGTTTISTGKATSKGTFSVKIPKQKAATKLSVRVKDSGSNYSAYTAITVQDKSIPIAPKVKVVTDNHTRITGTAEANSGVQVTKGTTTISTGQVTSKGTFSVNIPRQRVGNKLSVRVKDSGDNYSAFTSITVTKSK